MSYFIRHFVSQLLLRKVRIDVTIIVAFQELIELSIHLRTFSGTDQVVQSYDECNIRELFQELQMCILPEIWYTEIIVDLTDP